MKAPHGPATAIGSARRMWYTLSQWELALGLWGKKCSPLVCWAGTIISRACVFPLLEWRKIKLRNVERHLLSYCCKSISWPLQQLKLVMSLLSLVVQIEWLLLTTETILKHHCLPVPQIHQVHSEYMMFPFPLFLFLLRGFFQSFFSMMPSKIASHHHQWSTSRWFVPFCCYRFCVIALLLPLLA